MLQPENQSKKYEHLFTDIDTGRIKIPQFQREFVWSKEQTAKLIDSIIKGFPIGTFIFWKTREVLRHVKNIGNFALPDTPTGEPVSYVLDGQQRITSLYAVHKGLRMTKDGIEIDYRDIHIDLGPDIEEDEQIVRTEIPNDTPSVSVFDSLNGKLTDFIKKFDEAALNKIEIYQRRLKNYDFSTILISEYPIDIACEVFTRINTGGTELTLFEIMVAKTYDIEKQFDLSKEYDRLIDSGNGEKDLEDVGFEGIPSSVVLQCISAHICQQVRRRDILKLDKKDFIASWPTVKNGLFHTVDYIRSFLRVPVSRLLPYNAIIVPFTYFFIKNNLNNPSNIQHKLLTQYFFWSALSNRFTSGVESKIALDIKKMDDILSEKMPDYRGHEVNLTIDDIRYKWFSTGDAFCRAILCIYSYFEPKSFESNSIVKIDNDWLKVAFSKNYHHFFPKAFLKAKGFEHWQANSILNITIVDDYLNKRKIGAKAPSEYIGNYQKKNAELSKTLSSHLIDDLDSFGIMTDDYETFLECRGNKVIEELTKRLNPQI
jgi:hypothetical protein